MFEIHFRKLFGNSFLPKIKLLRVELKILSNAVFKCEEASHDVSVVMLLGVGQIKDSKITIF